MKIIKKLTEEEAKAQMQPGLASALEKDALKPLEGGGIGLNEGFIYCSCCDGVREEKHQCYPFFEGQEMSDCTHKPG